MQHYEEQDAEVFHIQIMEPYMDVQQKELLMEHQKPRNLKDIHIIL